MEDLEHAVAELLLVRQLGCIGLEDALPSEDVDKGGHQPLEECRVGRAIGIVVETVAQVGGGFDLEAELCKGNGQWDLVAQE